MSRPLTTGEIAKHLHVTHRAVLKWITSGKLKAYRTPGKHSRVERDDFLKFLNLYSMPIPDDMKGAILNRKKRILIVDDDKQIVKAINRALNTEGKYEFEEAFNGFSAGKKFSEFNPDLVILDIRMPKMDGFSVCKYIRESESDHSVSILVLSGVADKNEIEEILQCGANDFLSKPFENEELKAKVRELLGISIDNG